MPLDRWAQAPTVTPHGYGFSIPVGVTSSGTGTEDDPLVYDGIRVEVRSLSPVDVKAGVAADPDATDANLTEALTLALDENAPTVQSQLDDLIEIALGV